MKIYRCPYCGREAFDLWLKLGVNTTFGISPRCPFCKKVSFRNFVIGGHFLYSVILGLGAFFTICAVLVSNILNFNIGTLIFPLYFIAFYLIYNYYFCYFERVHKEGTDEKIQLQLKVAKNSWPNLRKGEIYGIGLLYPYDFATARDGYIVAMVEHIAGDKLLLRVLSKPDTKYFELKGDVAIFCGSTKYAATVISPKNTLKSQDEEKDKDFNDIEYINLVRDDKKATDWNYDFSSLPRWDFHARAYTFDLFVEVPKADRLLCIYSIVEASMLNYIGCLAILQNKQNPQLILNSFETTLFRPEVFYDKGNNIIFLIAHINNKVDKDLKEPIIILNVEDGKLACFETAGIGGTLKILKISTCTYEIQRHEFTVNRKTVNKPEIKGINLNDFEWHPLDKLNNLFDMLF